MYFNTRTKIGASDKREVLVVPVLFRVRIYYDVLMAFPIKVCSICSEEFELKPDKPGFANRCPECSADDVEAQRKPSDGAVHKADREVNEPRREAMRNLLYRKDS